MYPAFIGLKGWISEAPMIPKGVMDSDFQILISFPQQSTSTRPEMWG